MRIRVHSAEYVSDVQPSESPTRTSVTVFSWPALKAALGPQLPRWYCWWRQASCAYCAPSPASPRAYARLTSASAPLTARAPSMMSLAEEVDGPHDPKCSHFQGTDGTGVAATTHGSSDEPSPVAACAAQRTRARTGTGASRERERVLARPGARRVAGTKGARAHLGVPRAEVVDATRALDNVARIAHLLNGRAHFEHSRRQRHHRWPRRQHEASQRREHAVSADIGFEMISPQSTDRRLVSRRLAPQF